MMNNVKAHPSVQLFPDVRKRTLVFEGSQASPACPSETSSITKFLPRREHNLLPTEHPNC